MAIKFGRRPLQEESSSRVQVKNRGHVTPKTPHISLEDHGRLRSCHVLALCGFSHSTLYKRLKSNLFPQPDGRDGGLNFWNTSTIREYLNN